jgi:hypothetical protein
LPFWLKKFWNNIHGIGLTLIFDVIINH